MMLTLTHSEAVQMIAEKHNLGATEVKIDMSPFDGHPSFSIHAKTEAARNLLRNIPASSLRADKITFIKHVRALTEFSLKDAKELVEEFIPRQDSW